VKRRHDRYNGEGNITIRVVCAVLFVVFTFCWLFFFQGDMLAVAQYGLSGGKTHYNRTIGAVICTAVLLGVHLLVYAATRLTRRTHALTYAPSMLLLAFVSSVSVPFRWGNWLWAGPLLLALWGGAVWLSKRMLPIGDEGRRSAGLFSRVMWMNLLQLLAMMAGMAAVSNTNAVDHYKAHAEVSLMSGDVDEALHVGRRSLETDESLTMLRIFALSQKGQLADHLFEYAVSGSSNDMLPLEGSRARLMLMSDTLLWQHFGVSPDSMAGTAGGDTISRARGRLTVAQYLDSLECDTLATRAYVDYRLTGQLIDRQLDSFVVALPRYYPLDADSLPRHYREALVLYQQTDTLFIYNDSLMLSRWNDFHANDSIYPNPSERKIRTEEQFRGTYWYYYYLR